MLKGSKWGEKLCKKENHDNHSKDYCFFCLDVTAVRFEPVFRGLSPKLHKKVCPNF